MKLLTSIAVCCVLLVVAGCGGGGGATADSGDSWVPSSPPAIEIPDEPPTRFVKRDLRDGSGKTAEVGDEVTMHYRGLQWKGAHEHANSWRYGTPPTIRLGNRQQLNHGLDLGIRGMKEGGIREIQIPSELVYGPGSGKPRLSPTAALVYKVYLLEVHKKK